MRKKARRRLLPVAALIFSAYCATSCWAIHSDSAEDGIGGDDWFREKRLVKHLLSNHATHSIGRPVANHREPIIVEFGINLIQVLCVNESAGQLVTNIWTHYRWRDTSLSWNETSLGIDKVRVPSDEVWLPDVDLFNYADTRIQLRRQTLAVVNSTGDLDWIPSGIFRSTCEIDTFAFPFDEQVCSLSFRSLTMGSSLLKLRFVEGREFMSLDSYVPNPEWEIIGNIANRTLKLEHRASPTSYDDLTFTLRLKRRSVFHRYVLVLPCVLLSLTAGVLFLLPPESPAKIQIGIFIFQGFFLLLRLLMFSTPPASNRNPTLGLYYSASMISITFVMFTCGYLIDMHFRSDSRSAMPGSMRKIVINVLAAWLFIPIPKKTPRDIKRRQLRARACTIQAKRQLDRVRASIAGQGEDAKSVSSVSVSSAARKAQLLVESRRDSSVTTSVFRRTWPRRNSRLSSSGRDATFVKSEPSEERLQLLGDLVELRMTLQRTAENQATRDYNELIQMEWMIASMVFDRIFFMLYVVWIIISLWMLLPHEEKNDELLF